MAFSFICVCLSGMLPNFLNMDVSMNFMPLAPWPLTKQTNGLIATDKASLAKLWNDIDEATEPGLSGSIGCYIFSIRAGKGSLPWYVGMAEKQSFRKECFTPHKINHYNNAIASRRGTPEITLIPKYTNGAKLVNPTGNTHRDIQQLEAMLIGNCLTRNRGLLNLRDTKLLREMIVPGLLNSPSGNPGSSVRSFKRLIGV